jgi:hypothetical protein
MYCGPIVFVYPFYPLTYSFNFSIINKNENELLRYNKSYYKFKYYLENKSVYPYYLDYVMEKSINTNNFPFFKYLVDKGIKVSLYNLESIIRLNLSHFLKYIEKDLPKTNFIPISANRDMLKLINKNNMINNASLFYSIAFGALELARLCLLSGLEIPYEELMEAVDIALSDRNMDVLYYLDFLGLINLNIFKNRLKLKKINTKHFINSYMIKIIMNKL